MYLQTHTHTHTRAHTEKHTHGKKDTHSRTLVIRERRACTFIHILHLVNGRCLDNILDVDDIFMLKSCQNFYLAQGALAEGLMLERRDFLDSDALVRDVVDGGPGK
jgi:hypothetical protein